MFIDRKKNISKEFVVFNSIDNFKWANEAKLDCIRFESIECQNWKSAANKYTNSS